MKLQSVSFAFIRSVFELNQLELVCMLESGSTACTLRVKKSKGSERDVPEVEKRANILLTKLVVVVWFSNCEVV